MDALLPKVDKPEGGVQQVELGRLRVSTYQPRKRIDPAAIAELAQSIAEKGVLQPLLVRPKDDGYEIVAGERRFRASQQAGLTAVPVIVKTLSDRETLEIAIIENLQRESLSAAEEARAFKQLMAFGLSQEDVAAAVSKSRSAVANTLRLLKLPDAALEALEEDRISAGHARAVLAQPVEDQAWALQQILAAGLTVREAEKLKRKEVTNRRNVGISDGRYVQLETDLARRLGTKVKVAGGKKGRIELHFYSEEELERLLVHLGYES